MNNVLYMTREYGDGKELSVVVIAIVNGLHATVVSVAQCSGKSYFNAKAFLNSIYGVNADKTKYVTKTTHHKLEYEPTELYYDIQSEKYFEAMPSVVRIMSARMAAICKQHGLSYRMEETHTVLSDNMECTILTY